MKRENVDTPWPVVIEGRAGTLPTGTAFFADRMRVMTVPFAVVVRRDAVSSMETEAQSQQPLRTREADEQDPCP